MSSKIPSEVQNELWISQKCELSVQLGGFAWVINEEK
jgi:hypothetical protein